MPAAERGYGWEHRKERARWAPMVAAAAVPCARCGQVILPGQLWDLDHAPGKDSYLGPSHRRCNRREGAQRGNRLRAQRRRIRRALLPNASRQW